ncbi:MAG: helix-turn-helix domain-containing protein, partial [Thermaurantiacus sp.]
MRNRVREVRKARGLTLAEVAARCDPPTTAVTIGRLETGMRNLTITWVERLAAALEVEPSALIVSDESQVVPVAAVLEAEGAEAPASAMELEFPQPRPGLVGLLVRAAQGDYRTGDQLWLEQLPPDRFVEAINCDVLAPRPVGRFAFGRLVAVEGQRMQILPPVPGSRQLVVAEAAWLGRVTALVR